MGLLKHLLFWPVTGPTFLTRFSLEKVEGAVRTELTDDTTVRQELMELQLEFEMGAVDEQEYTRREAELMERLRHVREWRKRYGMPVAGGVVQVADSVDSPASSDEASGGIGPGAGMDVTVDFDED